MSEIIVKMDKHLKLKGGEYVRDIVRCQDCKHCKRKKGTFRGEPIFFYRCAEHSRDVESDDFCSWGERSE